MVTFMHSLLMRANTFLFIAIKKKGILIRNAQRNQLVTIPDWDLFSKY